MMSYEMTDDEINWKKETDTDTTGTNATASVTDAEILRNSSGNLMELESIQ